VCCHAKCTQPRGSEILPNCTWAASQHCVAAGAACGIATCLEKSGGVNKIYTRGILFRALPEVSSPGVCSRSAFASVVSLEISARRRRGSGFIDRRGGRGWMNSLSLSFTLHISVCERVRRPRARTIVGGRGATTQFFTPARTSTLQPSRIMYTWRASPSRQPSCNKIRRSFPRAARSRRVSLHWVHLRLARRF